MNTDHLLLTSFDLLLKSMAILTVAFTVQHFWRNASAAKLNLIWLMAFGALLLLPLTRLAPPRWAMSLAEKETAQVVSLPMELPTGQSVQAQPEIKTPPVAAPVSISLPDTRQTFMGIWAMGVVLVMARRMMGSWQLRRIKKQSVALPQASTTTLASRLAHEWGVKRSVELRESKDVPVPLTWGTLRPVLMLPQGADRWEDERLTAALQHELGHIKRYDVLTRGLVDLVCAIYWINPLVWWGAKAMRLTQERACDDMVLNAGVSADGYATQLLDSARSMQQRFYGALPAVAMAQPSTLETRLLAIVDEKRDRRPINRKAQFFASLAALSVLLLSATMQLRAEDSSKKEDSTKASRDIQISMKVIEAPKGTSKSIMPGIDPSAALSPEQGSQFIQKLTATPGTDMLTAPTVTTREGQKATIEVGREYASKGNDGEKTFTGISVSVLPMATEKGGIKIKTDALARDLVTDEPKPSFRESRVNSEVILQPDQTMVLTGSPPGGWKSRKAIPDIREVCRCFRNKGDNICTTGKDGNTGTGGEDHHLSYFIRRRNAG